VLLMLLAATFTLRLAAVMLVTDPAQNR